METKTYPGLNRVLVKQEELPDTGSLIATTNNVLSYGTIFSVGTIKDQEEFPADQFKAGDGVYFLTHAGQQIELPEGVFKLLNITEILVGVKQ